MQSQCLQQLQHHRVKEIQMACPPNHQYDIPLVIRNPAHIYQQGSPCNHNNMAEASYCTLRRCNTSVETASGKRIRIGFYTIAVLFLSAALILSASCWISFGMYLTELKEVKKSFLAYRNAVDANVDQLNNTLGIQKHKLLNLSSWFQISSDTLTNISSNLEQINHTLSTSQYEAFTTLHDAYQSFNNSSSIDLSVFWLKYTN